MEDLGQFAVLAHRLEIKFNAQGLYPDRMFLRNDGDMLTFEFSGEWVHYNQSVLALNDDELDSLVSADCGVLKSRLLEVRVPGTEVDIRTK